MNTFRDWKEIKKLGEGSFGTVYEVENTDPYRAGERAALKKIVIPKNASEIKTLRSDGYDDESITKTFESQMKEFKREYDIMRKLSGNTNIVNCWEVGYVQHEDGIGWDIYILMELLTPLREIPAKRFSEDEIIRLGKDLCQALVVCQRHQVIHRDIKPDNIFVSRDGDYKLGDFGIARVMEGTSASTAGIGTYDYMAPEVWRANAPGGSKSGYDQTVDIYSLGLVLYCLLNERRTPFLPKGIPSKTEKEQARDRRFAGEAIPAPAHGNEELKRIVLKACAYDPKERYQSAEEMLNDMNTLNGEMAKPPFIPISGAQEKSEDGKGAEVVFPDGKSRRVAVYRRQSTLCQKRMKTAAIRTTASRWECFTKIRSCRIRGMKPTERRKLGGGMRNGL